MNKDKRLIFLASLHLSMSLSESMKVADGWKQFFEVPGLYH